VSVVSVRRIRLASLADALRAVPADAGASGLRAAFAGYLASRAGEDTSAGAIALGYAWLSGGRFADGFTVFQINAETYPDDANAQFHFGEALRYAGRLEEAADQYRRVLELDEDHANARARLAEAGEREPIPRDLLYPW
jgi:tetratricopeptide (TPR) repeat protein